jgi:5-methylcytosine-specific restriction endonuclease McrA
MARKITILPGEVYGRLTTIERTTSDKPGAWWKCLCSCGNYKDSTQFNLVKGNIVSCGCKQKETQQSGKEPTFSVWEANMRTYLRKLKDAAKKSRRLLGSNQFTSRTISKISPSEVRNHFQYLVDSWELSVSEYQTLITGNCYYCGVEPSSSMDNVGKRGAGLKKNGIDRVNNSLGYTVANCVTACSHCNRGKNNMTQSDFFKIIVDRYKRMIS